ncbi:flagellar filament capping protein FliD [Lachnospiraceae bacterium C1.1]|nr:flagellar filament capping protein FliD [Lachnospiraceae bacterium C1.1]
MANRITGLNSGLDTETLITALTSRYQTKVDTLKGNQKKLSWKQDKWKELNKEIMSFYNSSTFSELRYTSGYNSKTTSVSDSSVATVTTSSNAINTTQTLSVSSLAKAGYLTGGSITNATSDTAPSTTGSFYVKVGDDVTKIDIESADTMSSIASKLNNVNGITASFDENNHRFYIGSSKMGDAGNFEIYSGYDSSTGTTSGEGDDSAILVALGLNYNTDSGTYDGKKIDGTDAQITLNGASYKSSNNSFEINGLAITVNQTTDSNVTLSTTTDTSGIYDNIKKFLKEYNTLINKMDALYNADSADSYKMLTDEQKDAMSDSEIEDWENKIKSALLRKDTSLYDTSQAMKMAMASSFTVNGKELSLSYFGIDTLGYFEAEENERYAYHIAGDSDDEYTSSKDDVLKTMIQTDPDTVSSFFMQLTRNLSTKMYDQMKGTQYKSAFTVYEDKLMASNYSSYNTKISEAEDELTAKQDYYYNKFAAMETALSKINSNSSAFASLIGGTYSSV